MTIINRNLESIGTRYPRLLNDLTDADLELTRFTEELCRDGSPTLRIGDVYIHSKFDPRKEAERFISSELTCEAGVFIVSGFGLGYHIEALYSKTSSEIIIVVEPDIALFRKSLELRDFSGLILSERVYFLIGGEPDDCLVLLEQYPGKLVQLIRLRSLYESYEQFNGRLEKSLKAFISRKEVNLSTLKRFGKLWVRNLSKNSFLLAQAPGVARLSGKFSGIPVMILAAGPSLDEIKPHLSQLRKRFLLVAVDTALRACLEKGIEPDFTIVADPQYWNTRHLDQCLSENTILLADTSAYPSVFRILPGKKILFSSSFPLGVFLESKTEIKGKLKAGGSVATAAWDFARIIRGESIWCAGLDLGFPGKQTHCKGSFFEQRAYWLAGRTEPAENASWHALMDAGLTTGPANGGGSTWTDKRMELYIRWFEDQMNLYPETVTWNLSERGIKIEGMPGKSIIEALAMAEIRDKIDFVLDDVRSIQCDSSLASNLRSGLDELDLQLGEIEKLAERGLELTSQLKKYFEAGLDLSSTLEKLSLTDRFIVSLAGKDIAGFILQNFVNDLLREKETPGASQIIENSFGLYKNLAESIAFHKEILEKNIQE